MKSLVIQISGKQGSGKSTLSANLKRELEEFYQVYPLKFAGPLYEMHDAVLNIARKYGFKKVDKDGLLLQILGTEWGRISRGEDCWIKAMQKCVKDVWCSEDTVVIIDDCRFENEFDAFPKSLRIRLTAPKKARKQRTHAWRDNEKHPSEVSLDKYEQKGKFDFVFDTSKLSAKQITKEILDQLWDR